MRDEVTEANRQLIADAFDGWAAQRSNVFELLADDASWTVAGSSRISGTFTGSEEMMREAVGPILSRLDGGVTPTLRHLHADGDWVAVIFDGQATALDGQPYRNLYSWHLRIADGGISEAYAFFDDLIVEDLLDRVAVQ